MSGIVCYNLFTTTDKRSLNGHQLLGGEVMAKFTDKELQERPTKKDKWLADPAARGEGQFCARVTQAGAKVFYFRYTGPEGKRTRYRIGSYDPKGQAGFTLKDARSRAGKLSQLYQSGVSDIKGYFVEKLEIEEAQKAAEKSRLEAERIAEEARICAENEAMEKAKSRLTVNMLFEKWLAAQLLRRKDQGKEVSRSFHKDVLPVIGTMYADEVKKGHISEVVDSVLARGANRLARLLFADLRQMFNWAVYRDWLDVNPTAKIRKSEVGTRDVERDRVLSDDEIKQLAELVPKAGLIPTTEAAVWICLSTCCRIGELLNARWEDIDLEKMVWLIPRDIAKNGQAFKISLSKFSVKQFLAIQRHRGEYQWLYPNRKKNGSVSSKSVTRQLSDRQRSKALSKRSQDTGILCLSGGRWTPHDLRRTGATLMATLGVRPEIIERCLNHIEQNKVRRIYQRYSYEPEMKQAWELLGERVEVLVSENRSAKIIAINQTLSR